MAPEQPISEENRSFRKEGSQSDAGISCEIEEFYLTIPHPLLEIRLFVDFLQHLDSLRRTRKTFTRTVNQLNVEE